MPAFIGDVFGLNYVYEQQLKNFESKNFKNWPESFNYGYFGGGENPAFLSNITRIDFFNETVSDPGKNLPVNISKSYSETSDLYAYWGGGYNPTATSSISRLDFSNETISDPGQKLSFARGTLCSVSSDNAAYFGGGTNVEKKGTVYSSTVDRLDYKNETISSSFTLPAERDSLGGVSNNSYGYFGGGQNDAGGIISNITRIDFSSDTANEPGVRFSDNIADTAGISNILYGYFGGGFTPGPGYRNVIRKMEFSSETLSTIGDTLTLATSDAEGVQNNVYGYFAGGFLGPGWSSDISRLDFSSDTTSNPGKKLPSPRSSCAGTSGKSTSLRGNANYGYFAGGFNPLVGFISAIARLDYSNETFVSTGQNVLVASENSGGVSSLFYGYFAGGSTNAPAYFSNISRINFSSETVSSPTTINLPQARDRFSTAQSIPLGRGYFAGGRSSTSTFLNTISRISFSEETVVDLPSTNLPSIRSESAGTSSRLYGYFAGGLNNLNQGFSELVRLDFSTEGVQVPTNYLPTPSNRILFGATQNDYYSYFGGGEFSGFYSIVSRLDFTTETVSSPNVLLDNRSRHATSSNNNYGFYVSGVDGVTFVCTVDRLDFSTEVVSDPGKNYFTINNRFSTVNTTS